MIDSATLITYVLIVLGFVFIPGPATLLTVARASTSGVRVGIATGFGIAAGDLLHTLMAIVGISTIVATSAMLFTIIKYLGAAYLIYLGVRSILAKAPIDPSFCAPPITAGMAFRQAILAELLNPKTALFFLAFLPQFVHQENGWIALQLTILGIIFVTLGLLSTFVFAVSAGHLGSFHATTHDDPTYIVDNVVHYCVANMPGAVARTSTFALNNVTLPFVAALANKGWRNALTDDVNLRNGLNVHDGHLMSAPVAAAQGKALMPMTSVFH